MVVVVAVEPRLVVEVGGASGAVDPGVGFGVGGRAEEEILFLVAVVAVG